MDLDWEDEKNQESESTIPKNKVQNHHPGLYGHCGMLNMPFCIAEPNNERQILETKLKEEGANHMNLEHLMSQLQWNKHIRIALINYLKESGNDNL